MRIAEFSTQWEGRTIDGAYPLRQRLGYGESSAVFLTTHDGRNAAIKLLPADSNSADAELSGWREAAKLSHPNLIRIFASGRAELDDIALLYVVMERAEEDLSQVLPDRSLTAVETRDMLEPTLRALEYLHGHGLVHAHLKPPNIMAVEDRLKISSDGLMPVGSPSRNPTPYDPPERTYSPASDVWSLGVTLAEVLTQNIPVNGALPANLPEPFAGIARGCLQRDPAARSAISQISALLGQSATPAIPRKRRFAPVGVWILLALVVIVVAGVLIMQTDTGASAPGKTVEAVKTPEPTAVPTPQPKQIAKASKPETRTEKVEKKKAEAPPKETALQEAPVSAPATSAPASGILSQPLPEITDQARATIRGKVKFTLRVDVGPAGNVTDVKLDGSGGSKYFTDRTIAAVRQWRFEPLSSNGSQMGQRWRVRFEYARSGAAKVQPQRVSP